MNRPAAQKPVTRIQREKRAAILEAALDIFSTHGFRGTSLDQIADRAGLSKPNLLYYFPSKDSIHRILLDRLLDTWLDPLREMNESGDPVSEIAAYIERKISLARDYPRESRLFAVEILRGAPHVYDTLAGPLRDLVDRKAEVMRGWSKSGRMADVDPYHLIFSIWAATQHYADFDIQVRAVLNTDEDRRFDDASRFLTALYTRGLAP